MRWGEYSDDGSTSNYLVSRSYAECILRLPNAAVAAKVAVLSTMHELFANKLTAYTVDKATHTLVIRDPIGFGLL